LPLRLEDDATGGFGVDPSVSNPRLIGAVARRGGLEMSPLSALPYCRSRRSDSLVATAVGDAVGLKEGLSVGEVVDCAVGEVVDCAVGSNVCSRVGAPVGVWEGDSNDDIEGLSDGPEEGRDDGMADGAVDGAEDGATEGAHVGSGVGFGVGDNDDGVGSAPKERLAWSLDFEMVKLIDIESLTWIPLTESARIVLTPLGKESDLHTGSNPFPQK
jgi:hypothetical protein